MKDKISLNNIKDIINEILNKENYLNTLDYDITLITIKEFYKTETFKKKIKLIKNPISKIMNYTVPIHNRGWYDLIDKKIFIILDYYKEEHNTKTYNALNELIFTIYHELQHMYQDQYPKNSYINFLMTMEKYIILNNNQYYRNKHDNFLIEIDANLFGITNTINYLKEYPNYISKNKDYLEDKYNKYILDSKIYDEQKMFEEFNKIIKNNPKKILKEYPIFNIFYKTNGKFNSLSNILTNTKKYNISPKITELILSSKSFIKQLDFTNITLSEKEYLIFLLENLYQKEALRQQLIKINKEKKTNKLKEKLYLSKNSLEQIKYRAILLDQLIDKKIEQLEYLPQKIYYESIPYILLKTKKRNL